MMMHGGGRSGRRGHGRPDSDPGGPGFGPGAGSEEEGYGPGGRGFGFGPAGHGFGMRMGFGPGGPGFGPRGHRRRIRGDVRAAVFALLAEEPRHGYAIMSEITERSGGIWRPSPGSVYPVLQQLQDEELISVTESQGRRVFSLTDAGRAYLEENREAIGRPWEVADSGSGRRARSLAEGMAALAAAVQQVARLADDAQAARAAAALEDARRTMYRILAGDDVAGPGGDPGAAGAQAGEGSGVPGPLASAGTPARGNPAREPSLTHEPSSGGSQTGALRDRSEGGDLSV